ncbi:acyl carrier protein [Fructobacillus sp. M158]|uniref:acyl carrier protein n=1 Tax=Fructobacillus parabroussonetiae TaxID=2713174 RepID=UPI00200B267D|nr:acyl carrier protein [Fructobacillus parabroussonetiae]MCK8616756.1 acyl carrier protein [Fructobacillus parabroussonetiae]
MALSKEQIYAKLEDEVAKRFNVSKDKIQGDHDFVKEIGADSIDVVELVVEVEDEFDLEIPDEDLDELTTLNKVTDYIYARQGK